MKNRIFIGVVWALAFAAFTWLFHFTRQAEYVYEFMEMKNTDLLRCAVIGLIASVAACTASASAVAYGISRIMDLFVSGAEAAEYDYEEDILWDQTEEHSEEASQQLCDDMDSLFLLLKCAIMIYPIMRTAISAYAWYGVTVSVNPLLGPYLLTTRATAAYVVIYVWIFVVEALAVNLALYVAKRIADAVHKFFDHEEEREGKHYE